MKVNKLLISIILFVFLFRLSFLLEFYNNFINFFVIEVIPLILFSVLLYVFYLIIKEITNNEKAILFSILIIGFVPIFVSETIDAFLKYPITLLSIFYFYYCLIRIKENKYLYQAVLLGILLPILNSSISFLLMISFLIYLIIVKIEDIKLEKRKRNLLWFFVVFSFIMIIPDKQILIDLLQDDLIRDVNFITMILRLGVLPILLGIFGIYLAFYREKKDIVFLFIGLFIGSFLLSFLSFINFQMSLMFSGFSLVLLSSLGLDYSLNYFAKTKFYRYKILFLILFIVLIIMAMMAPSYFVAEDKIKNNVDKSERFDLEYDKLFKKLYLQNKVRFWNIEDD